MDNTLLKGSRSPEAHRDIVNRLVYASDTRWLTAWPRSYESMHLARDTTRFGGKSDRG